MGCFQVVSTRQADGYVAVGWSFAVRVEWTSCARGRDGSVKSVISSIALYKTKGMEGHGFVRDPQCQFKANRAVSVSLS